MCDTDTLFEKCGPVCRAALWYPRLEDFERFVDAFGVNCSSESPLLDLTTRVRTDVSCAPPRVATWSNGALACICPSDRRCSPPGHETLLFTIIFVLLAIIVLLWRRWFLRK